MSDETYVVGIDLGTTNSEISVFRNGRVEVLSRGNTKMLPSCVGISPDGNLLVGEPARNQQLLYPERNVRSIKRRMGTDERIRLGEKSFSPPEISALILKELLEWARKALGRMVDKAVITVPAYFSDSQRGATREAGEMAGLEVLRMLNEPTAASLAYGIGGREKRTVMVYDLGGGTFDVSIVAIEGEVTEVLASHGNNQLGGDDFNDLLVEFLISEFAETHGVNLKEEGAAALSRIWWAAEEAKKTLSFEPYVFVREEALAVRKGKALHLDVELSRDRYEDMIRKLVESTLDSVSRAMSDAGTGVGDLDDIVLVGGATRTPLVVKVLEERTDAVLRQEVDPDLCVVLGAGTLASRLAGHDVDRVLVDISPYSFGPSHLGRRGGVPYPFCYRPVIRRNTPLPVTRTERYYTAEAYQSEVDVEIFQGDDPDALKNILVGSFRVEGLTPIREPNEVLCRMSLDLDGILKVTAIEKATGKSKQISITNAIANKTPREIEVARRQLDALFHARTGRPEQEKTGVERPVTDAKSISAGVDSGNAKDEIALRHSSADKGGSDRLPAFFGTADEAKALLERSRKLLSTMHPDDREDALELHERIGSAVSRGDLSAMSEAAAELKDLLFFLEGR